MSKPPNLPDEVLQFIARRIDSVPHLEALLLLRENASVGWTNQEVAGRVYVSVERAGAILASLCHDGFIVMSHEEPGDYRYNEAWDQNGLMAMVASSYRQQLVQVASLIHAKNASVAVRDFARAFEFKKKD